MGCSALLCRKKTPAPKFDMVSDLGKYQKKPPGILSGSNATVNKSVGKFGRLESLNLTISL